MCNLVEGLNQQHQLEGEYTTDLGGVSRRVLASEVKHNLFLILRELLQNALKHAGATRLNVTLTVKGNQLSLSVHDDGRGYDVSQKRKGGYRLHNVERRVKQLDGALVVESSSGAGTTSRVTVAI